jgi:hypothetical protein
MLVICTAKQYSHFKAKQIFIWILWNNLFILFCKHVIHTYTEHTEIIYVYIKAKPLLIRKDFIFVVLLSTSPSSINMILTWNVAIYLGQTVYNAFDKLANYNNVYFWWSTSRKHKRKLINHLSVPQKLKTNYHIKGLHHWEL